MSEDAPNNGRLVRIERDPTTSLESPTAHAMAWPYPPIGQLSFEAIDKIENEVEIENKLRFRHGLADPKTRPP